MTITEFPEPITDIFDGKPDPEQIAAAFRSAFDELEETPTELAKRMRQLGDHRSFSTILRSLQRMLAGDIGVSGEMLVIIRLLIRQQRARDRRYADLKWQRFDNGTVSATVDDFTLSLQPQTKGRWHVHLLHRSGYSPPWPTWQSNLDAAQKKALTCLMDAQDDLAEAGIPTASGT
jgi:hypothetical protein